MRIRTAVVNVSGAFDFAQTAGRGSGEGRTPILEKTPTNHSVAIPLARVQQYYKDMDGKKQQTLRMLEGGRYNVNIHRITNAESSRPIAGPPSAPEGGGNAVRNPGWRNGIRIGSAKDGSLILHDRTHIQEQPGRPGRRGRMASVRRGLPGSRMR